MPEVKRHNNQLLILLELLFLFFIIALFRLLFVPLSTSITTVLIVWLLLVFASYLVGEFESIARINYGLTARSQAAFALTYLAYSGLTAIWPSCEPLNVKFFLALWFYLTFLEPLVGLIFRYSFPQRCVLITDFNSNKTGLLRWWGFDCVQVVPINQLQSWLKENTDRFGRARDFYIVVVDITDPETEHLTSALAARYFIDFIGISSFRMFSYLFGPHPRRIGPFGNDGIARRLKRIVDLIISITLLIVLAPFLLVVALIIKLTTPGPVFYRHRRLGRNMQEFSLLKFRTMFQDADKLLEKILEQDPEKKAEFEKTFKLKNDPRVTPVGRWLRRTSIDELPQLLNVVVGHMSLVGPRPIVEKEIPYYEDYSLLLFRVPPGVAGLWQISGRTDLSYEERVRLDTRYVREWSLLGDLAIILKTVPVILSRRGAY
ncbi:MAG: sugar transferase [candidate division WOR-3 bacterium]